MLATHRLSNGGWRLPAGAARELCAESLAIKREICNPSGLCESLAVTGCLLASAGQLPSAAVCLYGARHHAAELGYTFDPMERGLLERGLAIIEHPGTGLPPDEREGNVIDHAEIVYHMAIANYRLERYEATLPLLKQAYSFFKSLSPAGLKDTQDRLVAVLDDLVLVSEKLGNTADADKYRAERDSLNK